MREKYLYDLTILKAKNMRIESIQKKYPALNICTDYFDYHNHVCPRCKEKLKVYNKTIKKVGGLSLFIFNEEKKIYLFAICKECSRSLKMPIHNSESSILAKSTEDYILSVLKE